MPTSITIHVVYIAASSRVGVRSFYEFRMHVQSFNLIFGWLWEISTLVQDETNSRGAIPRKKHTSRNSCVESCATSDCI